MKVIFIVIACYLLSQEAAAQYFKSEARFSLGVQFYGGVGFNQSPSRHDNNYFVTGYAGSLANGFGIYNLVKLKKDSTGIIGQYLKYSIGYGARAGFFSLNGQVVKISRASIDLEIAFPIKLMSMDDAQLILGVGPLAVIPLGERQRSASSNYSVVPDHRLVFPGAVFELTGYFHHYKSFFGAKYFLESTDLPIVLISVQVGANLSSFRLRKKSR